MLLSRHQNARQNYNNIFKICGKVQIFGNDYNKSELDSGGNSEEIQFG
jgi:hypothetical protein